jgi:O-antigen/teichoic acid export membrane protein
MAGLALLVSVVLGLTAPKFFRIPAEHRASTVMVAALTGASTGVALISGVFGGVIVGRQRFDLIRAAEIGVVLLRASLVLGVVATGGGLVELAGAQLVSSIAGGLLTARLSRRVLPQLRLQRLEWSWPHLRLIVSYGGYALAAHLSGGVIDGAGVTVIGAVFPMTAVTVFAIASGLVDYVRALAGGIRTTLSPLASALEARAQQQVLQVVILQGARYCTMLVLPIAAAFVVRGSSFIGLWMGAEYGGPSGHVLAILALRLAFLGATGAVASVMLGANRHRAVAGVMAIEALVTVAAILLLVRPLGVAGVAWGITIPSVAAGVLFWPWYVRRSFGVGVRQYIISSWVRPAIAVAPFAAAAWFIEVMWPAPSLLVFFAQMAALVPLALLGDWYVCLSSLERERCLALRRLAGCPTPRSS